MKTRVVLLMAVVAAAVFSGCCKVYCEENAELNVLFGNFRVADADTVYIIRYNKATQQISDSTAIINIVSPADTVNHSSLYRALSPTYDWKIVLPSVNKQYLFTQIETESGKCPCGGGHYTRISNYHLNNQTQTGGSINLP
ncbi:MAG TPA: hypothetical protein VNT20_17800 [Flavisolibacter sp.]|jgi:hypothetical protein|nr:hypothetical protein [Flavisolibacter sp.]